MEKKKVVIIGFGGMGNSWKDSIKKHPGWELSGIVDTNTELLENVENFNIGLDEDQAYMSIEDCIPEYGLY